MTFYTGPDLIERYEDQPSGPFCKHCGQEMDWEDCGQCEDGEYDAYELDPMWYDPGDTERCETCGGMGFWWWCGNVMCPGKRDGDADAT